MLSSFAHAVERRLRRFEPENSSRVHLRAWIQEAAASVPSGGRVLDAGAGRGPYSDLFDHAEYETADFGKVEKSYADLTYTCDLTAIPVEDGRFDLVLLSQVLEHVPDPIAVLSELRRVLRPDGALWASAPLFYEEHEQPYDFYRYTQFGWRYLAEQAGFEVRSLERLEGYDGALSYQLNMAAKRLPMRLLPLRVLFIALAFYFSRRDVRQPDRQRGMCKNYACILVPITVPGSLP